MFLHRYANPFVSSFVISKNAHFQLKQQSFRAEFEKEKQYAEIDDQYALGEEDTDERSMGWSAPEETETDLENQKHPAAAPATLNHFLTSPAKTRSKATAAKSRAPTNAATQLGPSTEVSPLFYFDEQDVV